MNNSIPGNNTEKKAYFQDIVKHPGKFENEKAYVPYFWEMYLDGCADNDDGEILSFVVTPEDIFIFPELEGKKQVQLVELENGFIVEI